MVVYAAVVRALMRCWVVREGCVGHVSAMDDLWLQRGI